MSRDPVEVARIGGYTTQVVRHLAPDADELILVVPGNPGAARFYVPFAEQLARLGGGRWHVAVAGHVGQVPAHPHPEPGGHFTLDEQVRHKLAFLDTLPRVRAVHVVGHSIGAWIALGVFDQLDEAMRGRGVLVCPTIERMSATPNGLQLTPLFKKHRRSGVRLAKLIHRLPGRRTLLERIMLKRTPPEHRGTMLRSILDLSPAAIDNILGLADEEMRRVVSLPEGSLRRHGERLCLYYAPGDRWNLPEMPDEIEAMGLGVQVVRGPETLRHSFVLDESLPVAEFTARQLQAQMDSPPIR